MKNLEQSVERKPANRKIITIGRQFGSGGKEVGEKLAKELRIPLYNKMFFEEMVQQEYKYYLLTKDMEESNGDKLFEQECKEVTAYAEEGACVIVGECADYILRGRKDVLSLYIFSEFEYRVNRIVSMYKISEKEAEKTIKKIDSIRKACYKRNTGRNWGKTKNYHMNINTGLLDIDETVNLIKKMYGDSHGEHSKLII